MRKYKLIKEYPGLPKFCIEGSIITDTNPTNGAKDSWFDSDWGKTSQSSFLLSAYLYPELYPEFWEEVKESEFKVGDWVTKDNWFSTVFRVIAIAGPLYKEYNVGTIVLEEHYNKPLELKFRTYPINGFRLATEKEITAHLRAEAISRGYKDGTYIERDSSFPFGAATRKEIKDSKNSIDTKYLNSSMITAHLDALMFGGVVIYQQGKWAKILPADITVEGYIGNFSNANVVSFGCKSYTKEAINQLISVMNAFEISNIYTLNTVRTIGKTTIEQIRDRMK